MKASNTKKLSKLFKDTKALKKDKKIQLYLGLIGPHRVETLEIDTPEARLDLPGVAAVKVLSAEGSLVMQRLLFIETQGKESAKKRGYSPKVITPESVVAVYMRRYGALHLPLVEVDIDKYVAPFAEVRPIIDLIFLEDIHQPATEIGSDGFKFKLVSVEGVKGVIPADGETENLLNELVSNGTIPPNYFKTVNNADIRGI